MSRSLIGTLLLATLTILFLLRKRERSKKAVAQQAQLEARGYLEISMDDAEPDLVTRSADAASRISDGVSLAVALFVISVVAFLAVTEPLVKWILSATLVLMGAIVMIWSIAKRRQ
jgi:hypothetical protein